MAFKTYLDEQYIMVIRNAEGATVADVTKALPGSHGNAARRLHELVEQGKLTEKRVGIRWLFALPEGEHD